MLFQTLHSIAFLLIINTMYTSSNGTRWFLVRASDAKVFPVIKKRELITVPKLA